MEKEGFFNSNYWENLLITRGTKQKLRSTSLVIHTMNSKCVAKLNIAISTSKSINRNKVLDYFPFEWIK